MTERKPQYTIKRESKAINRPLKPLKVGKEFHALLTAMYNETDGQGMTMMRITEEALKAFAERYYPQCLPVLRGGEIDVSKRPEPFKNATPKRADGCVNYETEQDVS